MPLWGFKFCRGLRGGPATSGTFVQAKFLYPASGGAFAAEKFLDPAPGGSFAAGAQPPKSF